VLLPWDSVCAGRTVPVPAPPAVYVPGDAMNLREQGVSFCRQGYGTPAGEERIDGAGDSAATPHPVWGKVPRAGSEIVKFSRREAEEQRTGFSLLLCFPA
jgi:hypothetical protein